MKIKMSPYLVTTEAGKTYFWCKCGKSASQPFCDGSHKGTQFAPMAFEAKQTDKVYFCGCKKTNNPPFCDGTHNSLPANLNLEKKTSGTFIASVEPDNKKIDISPNESILTASLRNNIPHLSACGGAGKCSTCRIEVLKGENHCSERTNLEKKLAKKLKFPNNIRLACQTKIHSDISYRRLLLDKRDLNLNSQVTQQKLESVGTIRNLTIMFCDIKGFTPFSESLSAYDVIFILNRYFSIMREVIIQNSGEINNYIGDAVMAIFGLKESRQQTLRATNAAIQMLEAMDEFKLYLNKAYGRDFDIRIGIHFGEVIVGTVGYADDKKFTIIGDAVNVASRIEAINKDAGTRLLVSDIAYKQIKKSVTVNNFLRLKLRGTSNLITLHEVNGVKENTLINHDILQEKQLEGETWVRTLPISELQEGEKKKFLYDGKEILLLNQKGIFAIENKCPHMNLPLDIGQMTDDGTILCPYHNSEFCFKSGEVRKWVGLQPKEVEKECEPLSIIRTKKDQSYIWIKK
tara:strand:+ start:1368 stop:2918 length:1551 start_codon:yes stop_codon:yes gene_type:complete